MTAEPASIRDLAASWLPGGLIVLVQKCVSSAESADASCVYEHEGATWRITLACAHEAATRPELQNSFGNHVCDWQTLVRERFAPLDAEARGTISAFLATALDRPCCRRAGGRALAESLHAAREGLRERLVLGTGSMNQPVGLQVDTLVAIDERTCYARGYCFDEDGVGGRLVAVSPEGARIELSATAYRFVRSDITARRGGKPEEKIGFACRFELPASSRLKAGWVFEWHSESGEAVEAAAPEVVTDIVRARDALLADLSLESARRDELLSQHIHPAIDTLQQRHHSDIKVASVEQYGAPPLRPECTIIIPLYQRIDFLEHQLAQFVHDPTFHELTDLIYVLDSPEQDDELAARASRLVQLYGVPFRIATLNRNGGYSAANNAGAALARGPLLLLLNSDVLPDRPGWLPQMIQFHRSTPGIGALGPKLLFEDETIQHAGLYFSPMPDASGWENHHYFKGMHRSLPAANVPRVVPAVTAACLLMERALYEKLGGLHGAYVQGDYEDSDLCLRLSESGLQNWYLLSVDLYHLEGQSYPAPLRALASRYNRWLHTRTWRPQITAAMQARGRLPFQCP